MTAKYVLIFLVIILMLLIGSYKIRDSFSYFINLFYEEKQINYSDEFTKNYISDLEEKIGEYEEIMSISDCIPSKILYRSPVAWYDEFTINKGANDVEEGMMVINNNGVLGVIKKVYNNSSIVSLITNPKNYISVKLSSEDKNVYGTITGYDKINDLLIVSELTSYIDSGIALTSGFTNDYKSGLLIGNINKVYKDNNDISYTVTISPIVDYNDINYVCVVK